MRITIIWLFILFSWSINAQPLKPYINLKHSGSATFISMEFFDGVLWASGIHSDNNNAIIWKYDNNGHVLDSIVFRGAEKQCIYNMIPYGDSVIAIGTQNPSAEEWQLVIHCLDKNMNKLWTKITNYEGDQYIVGFRQFERFNQQFVVIRSSYTHLFKFDQCFNFIETKTLNNQISCNPVDFTNRGFLMIKYGGWIVEIDTTFNEVDTLHVGYGLVTLNGKLLPTPNNSLIGTSMNLESIHRIIYLNSDYSIRASYPYFGGEENYSKFTIFRNLIANEDTTNIYSSGFFNMNQVPHPVHLGSYETNKFWLANLNPDSLIWYRFYEDSIYYYYIADMVNGPDGSIYLAGSRYNVTEQPDTYDAVIFKFNTEGDMLVGNKPEPQLQKAVKVYPNPGTNQLNIEIPEPANSTILLYNIQGKLVQSKQFRKQCQLNTEGLTQGIYFYRIVANSGNIFTGKWIKK